jgi:hypothetical protein
MKLKYFIVLLILFLATSALAMERNRFGVGVIGGEPTGITAKFMIDDNNAIDGGIGWELSGDNDLHIYGDYLYHFYDLIKVPHGELPLYFGGGLRFVDRDKKDDKFGLRFPVGVEYLFENVSLGAFFELAPVLNLSPDTDLDLEGGIGIRYFF